MSIAFLRNYLLRTVKSANQELMAALASIDPSGYDEAHIDEKEGQLIELGRKIEAYKRQHEEAKAEYDTAERLNSQRMAAVEILQQQLDGETDDKTKSELNEAISSQLDTITEAQDELQSLDEAADTALELFKAYDSMYQTKVDGFKSRRTELQQARRKLNLAEGKRGMAQQRSEAAAILAGAKTQGSDPIDNAIAAIKKKTDAINDDAASHNRLAGSLTAVDNEKLNPHIASAMAKAAGTPAASTDPKDRLAALRNQQAQRAA